MKTLVIALLTLSGCGISHQMSNPVQVKRSTLTINRIESQSRQFGSVYYIIWKDHRGVEYQEEVRNARDTNWVKIGTSSAQLLKR